MLAYDISRSPDMHQIKRMFAELVKKHGNHILGAILTSDQGYQYQHPLHQKLIKDNGMIQSMSRKGNCLNPTANRFIRTIKKLL